MQVSDIMTRDVQTVSPETDLVTVAQYMRDLDVGVIPVVEGTALRGIITDRDIVIRALAEGVEAANASVRDYMTAQPTTIRPTDDVQQVAQIMAREQIRRLPVVENGALVGIVALGDVAVEAPQDQLKGQALESISQPAQPRTTERGG